MYKTKINTCSLCIGFLLTSDKNFKCKYHSQNHMYNCPMKNEKLCLQAIKEFDDFIDEQSQSIVSLINDHKIRPGETITLEYDIFSRLLNNQELFKA
ncbi:hypothetical protein [Faecalitalea cylindroides]|uniref:hypothetical protein n=1 Tax=Faecalitalea cylindroides TaxID=39483 RepID=UPI003994AAD6